MSVVARLERLERKFGTDLADPFGLARMTLDELKVQLLLVSYSIAANPDGDPVERVKALAHIPALELEIRSVAQAWRNPGARDNFDYRREMYARRHGRAGADYELPITWLGDGDDAVPAVMARRRALRAVPEVAALLREVAA